MVFPLQSHDGSHHVSEAKCTPTCRCYVGQTGSIPLAFWLPTQKKSPQWHWHPPLIRSQKHTDLRAHNLAHFPYLWLEPKLASCSDAWSWGLCGINRTIYNGRFMKNYAHRLAGRRKCFVKARFYQYEFHSFHWHYIPISHCSLYSHIKNLL